ncbi:LOW QUALITY PROTEIN: urotensin 1 [Menidia menidia]
MKPLPLLVLLSCVLLSSHLRPAAGRPPPLPRQPPGPAAGAGAQDRGFPGLLLRRRLLPPEEEEEEDEDLRIADLLLKRREEPPLSIDLTFHLLRNMIQMARTESQRERAQLNRKVLDEVGK